MDIRCVVQDFIFNQFTPNKGSNVAKMQGVTEWEVFGRNLKPNPKQESIVKPILLFKRLDMRVNRAISELIYSCSFGTMLSKRLENVEIPAGIENYHNIIAIRKSARIPSIENTNTEESCWLLIASEKKLNNNGMETV